MTPADFTYGFIVRGGVNTPRIPCDWQAEFVKACAADGPRGEGYLSAFQYSEYIGKYIRTHDGSEAGFDGDCWASWFSIDVDREGDLPTALRDTRLIVTALGERFGIEPIVWFSGAKGFHIQWATACVRPEPSIDFHNICEAFALRTAGDVHIDTIIYSKTRLFRSPNSRHPKTGLYKIGLSVDELMGMSVDAITKLAEHPRPCELPDPPAEVNHTLAGLWAAATREVRDKAAAIERTNGSPKKWNPTSATFLLGKTEQGNRHKHLLSSASNLRELGVPLDAAHQILYPAAVACGIDDRAEIERHIKNGYARAKAPAAPVEWEPPPVDVLPDVVREFVTQTAEAIQCNPASVLAHALPVLASAIGTTREAEVHGGWCEPSIIWSNNILPSGLTKTAIFNACMIPLYRAQDARNAEHAAAMEKYKADLRFYNKNKDAAQGDPPKAPIHIRYEMSDATIEAIAPVLQANPRGVLLGRDEMSGLFDSMNAYKAKGRGADESNYLELWSRGRVTVDRKTGEHRLIVVRRAAASITGTIQPYVLKRAMEGERMHNGFAARFLFVAPPTRAPKLSSARVPLRTIERYDSLVTGLLGLEHLQGEHGLDPVLLPLTRDAHAAFEPWHNNLMEIVNDMPDDNPVRAAWAKSKGYAIRFALVFTLARNPLAKYIDADAVDGGCTLADWYAREWQRLFGGSVKPVEDAERRRLMELVERRGGSVAPRDLISAGRFRTAEEATDALNRLVSARLGWWDYTATGGRGKRFVLGKPEIGPSTSSIPAGPVENAESACACAAGASTNEVPADSEIDNGWTGLGR